MQKSVGLITKYTLEKYGKAAPYILKQLLTCQKNIINNSTEIEERLYRLTESARALLKRNRYKLRKLGTMNMLLETLTQLEILKRLRRLDAASLANLKLKQQALLEEKEKRLI